MKITLDVPDHKAAFILEVLAGFPYVKTTAVPRGETEYLLSSDSNRRELMDSVAQMEGGEGEAHDFPA